MGVSKSIKPDLIPEDCIRVGNKLYNAEKIESWHPGGRLFIQAFTGHDATTTFVQHHRNRVGTSLAFLSYSSFELLVHFIRVSIRAFNPTAYI